jgi:hypothetical protein
MFEIICFPEITPDWYYTFWKIFRCNLHRLRTRNLINLEGAPREKEEDTRYEKRNMLIQIESVNNETTHIVNKKDYGKRNGENKDCSCFHNTLQWSFSDP